MEATMTQPEQSPSLIHTIPAWLFHAIVIGAFLAAIAFITFSASSEAAAEAAAAGEESDFELEDVYAAWAQILLVAVAAEAFFFGLRRRWAFASVVQVALIILLLASFALITQQVERDVYEIGVMALVILTIIQIPFGNIPAQTNFRNSMLGAIVGVVIVIAIVAFSIWLVPYLIQLGR